MPPEGEEDSASKSPPPSEPEPSRPLTIDDVPRLGSGSGIAIGCAVIVVAAIVLFWLVRGWWLHRG
jgi:hypothetical protein